REREDPIRISGKKVRELMAEEGCVVTYARKRRRYNSYKGEIGDAPGNLVARDFRADAPNRLWLTDVTQFRIPAGKAYLSPVIDCFDGMPVAWTIRERPDAEMANTMLEEACATLGPGEAPVIHSDRGCHYRWPGWLEICERHGLERSMSRKGCSPDNSAMEGFFGRLKNEFFYGRDWEGVSLEDFASQLDGYMRYYRCERIKRSLGWMSPSQ
ncbi:IS3 family transposase, partial [Collinsella bouchesdurhonensis]|uniref:IS3 family transposase n=1 Tax=Collinsella bouchesdurhonensis TaxID=1907654 RepID=UPI003563C57D